MQRNENSKERKGILSRIAADKSGNGYIMWTVLIVVLCMILSCVMSYIMSITLIAGQRDVAQNLLDKQLASNSVDIFQKIKEQDDYTNREFVDAYFAELVTVCDLDAINTSQYQSVTAEGETRYVVTVPTITYEEDFSPKLVLKYTITVPVAFAGLQVSWVDVPVVIVSRYNPKYDMS